MNVYEEKQKPDKELFEVKRDGKVMTGGMVGRFCDPSYDSIELLFPDGMRPWFQYREVRPIQG